MIGPADARSRGAPTTSSLVHAAAAAAAAAVSLQVTCGSVVKLEAGATRHYLHSHEVSYGYGRGSGQQSVTGYPERESANSLWTVRVADVRARSAWLLC